MSIKVLLCSVFVIFLVLQSGQLVAKIPPCDSELHELMHDGQKHLKAIRRAIVKGEDATSQIQMLVASIQEFKNHQPIGFGDLDEITREEKQQQYELAIDDMLALVNGLLTSSDPKSLLKEINGMRKQSHRAFKRCKSD